MFGYLTADRSSLTEEQLVRYRGYYCGLCRTLGRTYGNLQRLALNYDLTFLVILLSSLYEPTQARHTGRCIVHPFSSLPYRITEATEYCAAMNMLLAYHQSRDDWQDDRNTIGGIRSVLFRKSALLGGSVYLRQQQAVSAALRKLDELERGNAQDPDACANAFGKLMAEILVWQEDRWSPTLREMGHALGRFIYLMDAVLDLPEDLKRHHYNPLTSRCTEQDPRTIWLPVLTMLMGECTEAFERLPLVQDLDLLRNILYSGVWTRFRGKPDKEVPHV